MDENLSLHGSKPYPGVSWNEIIRDGWGGTRSVITGSLVLVIFLAVSGEIWSEKPWVLVSSLVASQWVASLDDSQKSKLNLIAWTIFGIVVFAYCVISFLVKRNRQLVRHINERIVPIEGIAQSLLSSIVMCQNPPSHLSAAAALLYWERNLRNGELPDTIVNMLAFYCESNWLETNRNIIWRWMDFQLVDSVPINRTVKEKRTETVKKGDSFVPTEVMVDVVKHHEWKLTEKGSDVVAALKRRGVQPNLFCTCGLSSGKPQDRTPAISQT
jgi:hypothetical protein